MHVNGAHPPTSRALVNSLASRSYYNNKVEVVIQRTGV